MPAPRNGWTCSTAAGRSRASTIRETTTRSRRMSFLRSRFRSRGPGSTQAANRKPRRISSLRNAMRTSCMGMIRRQLGRREQKCDAYHMHGDDPAPVGKKLSDMRSRREELGMPPLVYGIAGYAIVRDSENEAKKEVERITNVQQFARGYENYQQWISGSKLEQKISLEDYSVSNR